MQTLLEDSTVRQRYRDDPTYKAAVDMIYNLIRDGFLSTHDVAEAAVLATQIYSERHASPITVVLKKET